MREALLTALLSQSIPPPSHLQKDQTLNAPIIIDLIDFILNTDFPITAESLETPKQQLAITLLQEPYPFESTHINGLARLLTNEQLIKLIFNLLPHRENKDATIALTIEQLIHILTTRATTS